MKKLILALLILLPALVSAQDFKHRYFHYDQYYDAGVAGASSFQIIANTIDTADNRAICISGGGLCFSGNRGGYIAFYGNEYGTTGGALQFGSAGGFNFFSSSASNGISFSNSNSIMGLRIIMPSDTTSYIGFGPNVASTFVGTIRSSRDTDGTDDDILQLTAGGSSTMSGTRGAYIQLEGADVGAANAGGDINIVGGVGAASTAGNYPIITIRNDTADGSDWGQVCIGGGGTCNAAISTGIRGGEIRVYGNETPSIGGNVELLTGNGGYLSFWTGDNDSALTRERWRVPVDANNVNADLAFGPGGATANGAIRALTNDGSDAGTLYLCGGGGLNALCASTTRGAYIALQGDDVGGAGAGGGMTLEAGTGTTGTIKFNTAGLARWAVDASGNLAQDATNGGNIVFGKPSTGIFQGTADGTDNLETIIGGGGSYGNTRGATVYVDGTDFGGAGVGGTLKLVAGDGTNGFVRLQTQGNDVSFYDEDRNGLDMRVKTIEEELTIAVGEGAAGKVTAGNICPSGLILGINARVTQAPGGGATTVDIGCTGSGNLDQFCDGVSTAAGTTCTYPLNGDGTNAIGWAQKAATTATVTTDANVTTSDMKVRVITYYIAFTAPAS
jgi:hypothetical protein